MYLTCMKKLLLTFQIQDRGGPITTFNYCRFYNISTILFANVTKRFDILKGIGSLVTPFRKFEILYLVSAELVILLFRKF